MSTGGDRSRFTLIDGLRGIASLAVVFFHLDRAVSRCHPGWASPALSRFFSLGWAGVPVFFVLSGFVISYSIRKSRITASFFGRFYLRRMLRLDPPYWASMALAISLTALSAYLFPDLHKELPSLRQVALHLFYLQDLAGVGNIVDVYWTLCLEIQFYLLLVLLVGLLAGREEPAVAGQNGTWERKPVFLLLIVPLLALSLLQYFDLIEISPHGLFLPYWYQFSLGAMAWWTLDGRLDRRVFFVFWGVVALFWLERLFRVRFDFGPLAALITSLLLYAGGRRQALKSWLSARPTLYLGTISYSLYLIHPILGWRAISLYERILGPDLSRPLAVGAFCFGVLVSLVSTHIFYCLVERPSHQFSRRIRLPRPNGVISATGTGA